MTAKAIMTIAKLLEMQKNDLREMEREIRREYEEDRNRIYDAKENAGLTDSEIEQKCHDLGSYSAWETVRNQHGDVARACEEFFDHDWH